VGVGSVCNNTVIDRGLYQYTRIAGVMYSTSTHKSTDADFNSPLRSSKPGALSSGSINSPYLSKSWRDIAATSSVTLSQTLLRREDQIRLCFA
jgi:hypothetical protein